jgi:hypothetical protein
MLNFFLKILRRFRGYRQDTTDAPIQHTANTNSNVILPIKLKEKIKACYPTLDEEDATALASQCENMTEVTKVMSICKKTYLPVQIILANWEFYKNV